MALYRVPQPEDNLDYAARQWRNNELERTDTLALLPDYPQAEALLVYRQALRDWTDSEDFPDVRPEMAVEAVQPEEPTEPTEE